MKICNRQEGFHQREGAMFEISPQFISMWEASNEPWGVEDKTSHDVYGNKAYLDLLCLPPKFNIENILDDSLPHPCAEFAPTISAARLIDFCIEEGFDTYIPPRFLQPSHRLINNNEL